MQPIASTTLGWCQEKGTGLASAVIQAREIEEDNSDLHDGIDDLLSFGPQKLKRYLVRVKLKPIIIYYFIN